MIIFEPVLEVFKYSKFVVLCILSYLKASKIGLKVIAGGWNFEGLLFDIRRVNPQIFSLLAKLKVDFSCPSKYYKNEILEFSKNKVDAP